VTCIENDGQIFLRLNFQDGCEGEGGGGGGEGGGGMEGGGGRGEGVGGGGRIRDIDPSMDSSGVWNFFADL
jgi:hypothetical protein